MPGYVNHKNRGGPNQTPFRNVGGPRSSGSKMGNDVDGGLKWYDRWLPKYRQARIDAAQFRQEIENRRGAQSNQTPADRRGASGTRPTFKNEPGQERSISGSRGPGADLTCGSRLTPNENSGDRNVPGKRRLRIVNVPDGVVPLDHSTHDDASDSEYEIIKDPEEIFRAQPTAPNRDNFTLRRWSPYKADARQPTLDSYEPSKSVSKKKRPGLPVNLIVKSPPKWEEAPPSPPAEVPPPLPRTAPPPVNPLLGAGSHIKPASNKSPFPNRPFWKWPIGMAKVQPPEARPNLPLAPEQKEHSRGRLSRWGSIVGEKLSLVRKRFLGCFRKPNVSCDFEKRYQTKIKLISVAGNMEPLRELNHETPIDRICARSSVTQDKREVLRQ